jgi:hypothetical protein
MLPLSQFLTVVVDGLPPPLPNLPPHLLPILHPRLLPIPPLHLLPILPPLPLHLHLHLPLPLQPLLQIRGNKR